MTRQIKVTIVCGFFLIVLLFLFTDVFEHSRFIGEPADIEMTYHERRLAASKEDPVSWSSSNVVIGYNVLRSIKTGQNNVFVGYDVSRKE